MLLSLKHQFKCNSSLLMLCHINVSIIKRRNWLFLPHDIYVQIRKMSDSFCAQCPWYMIYVKWGHTNQSRWPCLDSGLWNVIWLSNYCFHYVNAMNKLSCRKRLCILLADEYIYSPKVICVYTLQFLILNFQLTKGKYS